MIRTVRVLATGAGLAIVLGLSGCGQPSRPTPTTATAPSPGETTSTLTVPSSAVHVIFSVADRWSQVQRLHQFLGGQLEVTQPGGPSPMPELYATGLWSGDTTPMISAHPAYDSKTGKIGDTYLKFTVTLPDEPTRFVFGAGLSPGAEASDGVQFTIRVDGKALYDQLIKKVGTQPGSVELTAYAGKTVTVEMVTGPGQRGNIAFDWALWQNPKIVS